MTGALALLSLFTVSLTSCDDDDNNTPTANVTFSDVEVGHEGEDEVLIGKEIHVEAAIRSAVKIKSIEVDITPKDKAAGGKAHYLFADAKYTGVLNTTFHEHIAIPQDLKPGTYRFALTVTDANGARRSHEAELKLVAVNPDAPIVKLDTPNDNAKTGVAGSTIAFKATITVTKPVKEIEIEFHGAKEYPIEIDDYNGKTGTFTFEKNITIPAHAAAGTYHLHFTVEDEADLSTTAEVEGFTITQGK